VITVPAYLTMPSAKLRMPRNLIECAAADRKRRPTAATIAYSLDNASEGTYLPMTLAAERLIFPSCVCRKGCLK
jgi:hypothetical protein